MRGISSLLILQGIMEKLTGSKDSKPCDYFDLMAGTSTGGLIAIMLARLRMSVPDCITAYHKLATQIFGIDGIMKAANVLKNGAQYSGDTLAKAIQDIAKDHTTGKNPNEPLRDTSDNACKA